MDDKELRQAVLQDYAQSVNEMGSGGGSRTIDLALGNVVTCTVSTSTTTFTFSNPSPSGTACSFTLILTNGGSQTVNWPSTVRWAGDTEPTLTASGTDVLSFLTVDAGAIWYGFVTGLDVKVYPSSLLLHMNGSNGSTTFTDSSPESHTVTPSGNAQISTAQSKFGGASGLFDGTTDLLSIPTDTSLDFGTGDFTIEWFQYWNSIAGYQTIYDYGYTSSNGLLVQTNTGTGKYRVFMNGPQILEETNAASTGVWYYYALTRSGTTVTLYRDGVSNGSGTSSTSVTGYALGIGAKQSTGEFCLNGYVDELRVTKGLSRVVTSVPTGEFPDV